MRNWWKSLTVKGAITGAVGLACDPRVWALLPAPWARSIALVGAACTVVGIRRALPAPAGGAQRGF
jgi:hypothetical protein